ncbi:MAG: PKD domain-containing protein, partial [Acidimicrobiia bacterium]|nr:PKD domain-containing protein [Acidimicrobiia bacterium]
GDPHEITISDKALGAHVGDDKHEGHGDLEGECPDLDALPPVNTAPIASVIVASSCFIGCTVTFDGSGSFDEEGDALTYQWNITGPNQTWSSTNPTAFATGFSEDPFSYEFTISDGEFSDTTSGTYIIP